jgi:hypothetical protein
MLLNTVVGSAPVNNLVGAARPAIYVRPEPEFAEGSKVNKINEICLIC